MRRIPIRALFPSVVRVTQMRACFAMGSGLSASCSTSHNYSIGRLHPFPYAQVHPSREGITYTPSPP